MQNAHRALFTRVAIVPAAVDVLAGNHGLTAVESLAALDGLVGVDGLACNGKQILYRLVFAICPNKLLEKYACSVKKNNS